MRSPGRLAKFSALFLPARCRIDSANAMLSILSVRALEEFQSLGVDFVSLTEAIDTSTPAGKMVFTVLGAVAELERAIIRERVIAGQKAAKRRGVRFGRPNVAVPLAQIEKLRQKGMSWRVLEAQTGIAKDTLRRAFMLVQTHSRSLT